MKALSTTILLIALALAAACGSAGESANVDATPDPYGTRTPNQQGTRTPTPDPYGTRPPR